MALDIEGSFSLLGGNRILLVAFSGFVHRLGMREPPFMFLKSIFEKHCDIIFLRDGNKSWYHFGVPGIGSNIFEVAGFLQKCAKYYERVIFLGNSMGGYGAILISHIIRPDLCLAMTPQTFIDIENRQKYNDNRNAEDKTRVCRTTSSPELLDLKSYFKIKNIVEDTAAKSTCHIILFGDKEPIDDIHATRMSEFQSFHIFKVNGIGHNLANYLRQRGILDKLVDQILQAETPSSVIQFLRNEPILEQYIHPNVE